MKGPLDWMVRKLEFTKGQAMGTFYLASLIAIAILAIVLFDRFYAPPVVLAQEDVAFHELIDSLRAEVKVVDAHDLRTIPDEKLEIGTYEEPSVQHLKRDSVFLNSCGIEELKEIKGIGDKLSARIVKYRDKLGGFVNTDQLYEVYYIDSSAVTDVKDLIIVDHTLVNRIDVNSCSFKELLHHPYYDYDLVKSIFQLKDKNQLNEASVDSLFQTKKDVNKHAFQYLKF